MTKHTHYIYTFGESFCRRTVESFSNIRLAKCRSTEDEVLVGGGHDFCSFVVKQEVKYAASRPSLYQTPRVTKCSDPLVPSKTFISEEKLNRLFTFTVHMAIEEEGPSAKRMKVELSAEPSRNELFAISLRELLDVKELVIDTGNIDETPPVYSPFNRSSSDLYMYHKEYYKQGMITSVACVASDSSDEERDEELTMTCSGVLEMKSNGKATKQLCAYMLHIGSQITVKALKEGEIVDLMIVYGLAVNYEKKCGWLYKLTVNFRAVSTVVENFGKFSVTDAINIILEKINSR